MTFVWLTPLVIFVLFSSVILFHETIREKSLTEWEASASRSSNESSSAVVGANAAAK